MLVTLKDVNKKYIDKVLLNNVNLSIEENDKIGILGINGAGKSTLLKILVGEAEIDSGTIYYKKDLKISYMPQNPIYNSHNTILEEVLHQLKEVTDFEAKSMLNKLGLDDYNKYCLNLSGGELRRLSLAITLLKKADMLLLDEPTNHLDVWMISWLEEFLIKSNKVVVLVTHDRYFLERVTKKIVEVENGNVYEYEGNYSFYLNEKAERLQFMSNNERRLSSILKRETEWVKMNAQARSTKSKERLERYENLNQELKDIREALNKNTEVDITSIKSRIGKKTIIIENLSKSFKEKTLFKDFNYILDRFDRLGIVGENGCGKSTLFNIITGNIEPDKGTVTIGTTIKIGYFHQQMEIKNKKITPIEFVKNYGEFIETINGKISASDLLDNYLITGSMQYMPIEKLSGGEIKRLQLLSILIQNPNVLFLDEPTNDLDIVTLSKLEDFLETFSGAIVVVSHDRYFLDKVTNHLLYYRNNNIHMYNGNVTDLIKEYKKEEEVKVKEKKIINIPRFTSKEKKEFDNIEKDIENIENEIENLKKEIENNSTDYVKIIELQEEIGLKEMELLEKLDRWEYLSKINEDIENYRKGKYENA